MNCKLAMKNFFNILGIALSTAFVLSSCHKSIDPTVQAGLDEPRFSLEVSLGGSAGQVETKVTGETASISAGESKVSSLQVLVFRGDFLDAYAKTTSASASVSCTKGSRTVYAVVNAPDLSGISSLAALKSKVVDLADNSATSFVMVGSKSVTIPASGAVSIDVERIVSRVVVKSISRDFESPSLAALSFKVDKIYLVNAAGSAKLDLSGAPGKWYNEGSNKSQVAALISDSPAAAIADKASYSTPHYFYAMPNPASSKKTLLVIEATLGTQKYYYPVELPALEHNCSYEISKVTVKRPGSDTPTEPVTSSSASFTVKVTPWATTVVDEKII